MYMKHCKVLIEHITDSKDKKKCIKNDKNVVYVERGEERDPEVEMMARTTRTNKENKLVMRCFCQSEHTRGEYQKRMIAIWREIGTFVITEKRLVDLARVVRTNEWLTAVELEKISRKI